MIRVAILAIAVIGAAVMFLPETVAMFPNMDSVLGAISADIGNIRDDMISSVKGAVSDTLAGVSDRVASATSGA